MLQQKLEQMRQIAPEAVKATVPAPAIATDEKIYTIRFTIRTTREKALKLKAFMIKEEIEYANE